MNYRQALVLQATIKAAFPWADEVNVTRIFSDEDLYFVGLWWNHDVITTFRDAAKFEHFLAFMAIAGQKMEVAS